MIKVMRLSGEGVTVTVPEVHDNHQKNEFRFFFAGEALGLKS